MSEEPRKSPSEPRVFQGTHFECRSLRRAVKHLERSLFSFKRGLRMSLLWRYEKSGPRNQLRYIVHV